jgi:signal transduction histidine kinase
LKQSRAGQPNRRGREKGVLTPSDGILAVAGNMPAPVTHVKTGSGASNSESQASSTANLLLLAWTRVVLGLTGLFVIWLVPAEPARFVTLAYASLVGYVIYGLTIIALLWRTPSPYRLRWLAWVDMAFAAFVMALTGGTDSIFFFMFFFAILAAAFTHGFMDGLAITVLSVVLYAGLGTLALPSVSGDEVDRLLIRPMYLATLGFLVSYWGGSEMELKRRLALLSELSAVANVRDGVHATIDGSLRRLREYFRADAAMLALKDERVLDGGLLHSVSAHTPTASAVPMDVSHETLNLFMAVPGERANAGAAWPNPRWSRRLVPLGLVSRTRHGDDHDPAVPALANMVETNNIAVAAYRQGETIHGRLVLARSSRHFNSGEAAFLAQCGRAMATVVENVRLAEELVAQAAEYERINVSRDLHDTTIQPYIGLRMAIEGVLRDFRHDRHVVERLSRLLEMTDLGIRELRDYTARLKSGGAVDGRAFQLAIERQVERLGRHYVIVVDLEIDLELRPGPRIEDAVLHLVAEGLSNVHRHSRARKARIAIQGEGGHCRIEIANQIPDGEAPPREFLPTSMAERCRDMGGRCVVESNRDGYTVVTILLPQPTAA